MNLGGLYDVYQTADGGTGALLGQVSVDQTANTCGIRTQNPAGGPAVVDLRGTLDLAGVVTRNGGLCDAVVPGDETLAVSCVVGATPTVYHLYARGGGADAYNPQRCFPASDGGVCPGCHINSAGVPLCR